MTDPYHQIRRDYLYIGATPCDEECAQVGHSTLDQMRRECRAYINQLIRHHGEPLAGADYEIKREEHDYGPYLEVVIWYENPEGLEYALKVEGDSLERWDSDAKKELGL